jgi:hypothetical protein
MGASVREEACAEKKKGATCVAPLSLLHGFGSRPVAARGPPRLALENNNQGMDDGRHKEDEYEDDIDEKVLACPLFQSDRHWRQKNRKENENEFIVHGLIAW